MDNMKQTKQYQFSCLPYKNFKSFSLKFFLKKIPLAISQGKDGIN